MLSRSTPVRALVGTQNPVKHEALKKSLAHAHPESSIELSGYSARPFLTWKSQYEGQPYGMVQTARGAINRANDAYPIAPGISYVVAFENGLVPARAMGDLGPYWHDVCFTAIRSDSNTIIKRGKSALTPFHCAEGYRDADLHAAAAEYRAYIMDLVDRKIDPYPLWTNQRATREQYLEQCCDAALLELSRVREAEAVVAQCVDYGMSASSGQRYRGMLWTRDLAYMAPIYLKQKYEREFLAALKRLRDEQAATHATHHDAYATFDHFGKLPIVCLSNAQAFLNGRLVGSEEEPGWQKQLWNFVEVHKPELLERFPMLAPDASYLQLFAYYRQLTVFREELLSLLPAGSVVPGASFALRAAVDGTLGNLTPGTRDSEIHYLRSIFALIEHRPAAMMELLNEEQFAPSMARALCFLSNYVIDPADGLPRGADTRDIFADLMYDAKLLSNAVFWYQALQMLVKYSDALEGTAFRATIAEALRVSERQSPLLLQIGNGDQALSAIFATELSRLKHSIQSQFLMHSGTFSPIDFIPGERAKVGLDHPLTSSPVISLIKEHNPGFVEGQQIDPQGLAYAVLAGLVPSKYYSEVCALLKAADSPIGVQVFVPISGKTEAENQLLKRAHGQVVWPQVSWSVVRALTAMGTDEALDLAEVQREKIAQHCGHGEWYAMDPVSEAVIQGGDPAQGWSATSCILAQDDLWNFYAKADELS